MKRIFIATFVATKSIEVDVEEGQNIEALQEEWRDSILDDPFSFIDAQYIACNCLVHVHTSPEKETS